MSYKQGWKTKDDHLTFRNFRIRQEIKNEGNTKEFWNKSERLETMFTQIKILNKKSRKTTEGREKMLHRTKKNNKSKKLSN